METVSEEQAAPAPASSDVSTATPRSGDQSGADGAEAPTTAAVKVQSGFGDASFGREALSSETKPLSTAGDDSQEPLTFGKNMWDKFEILWQNRVEPSQQLLSKVAEILRGRAAIERRYAESIVTLSTELTLNPEESSLHGAVDCVMVNFRNRGEQSAELATEIEYDIAATFDAVLKQHVEVSRKILHDVRGLNRYYQDSRHAYDRFVTKYSSKCAEAEAVAQECLQGVAMKSTERTKLAMRATLLTQQARVVETEYYSSIEQVNQAHSLLMQHMPHVLSTLQDMEEKRTTCLKDGLMKLAVYETSWLRNLQYDLEATVKAGETVDSYTDLQEFIRQHQSNAEPTTLQFTVQPFYQLGAEPKEMPKLMQAKKARLETEEVIRQLIDVEVKPLIHGMLNDGIQEDNAATVREKAQQLRKDVVDLNHRAALCFVLRGAVLLREPQGTEVYKAKPLLVASAVFEILVGLFMAGLDACDEQNDAWCGRDFAVLTQLFRTEDGGKVVTMLTRVYKHPIWNKVTFWEEVLVVGLCEAHAAEAVWRRSVPAGSRFVQPAMTVFMQRFVGYMLAFGIRFEEVQKAIWTTLRKHTQLVGPNVKPYAGLLLSAYQFQSAAPEMPAPPEVSELERAEENEPTQEAVTSTGSHEPGNDEQMTEEGGDASPPGADEADFEAMALGVQSGFGDASFGREALSSETKPLSTEALDGDPSLVADSVQETPTSKPNRPADTEQDQEMQKLVSAQRTTSDVFG